MKHFAFYPIFSITAMLLCGCSNKQTEPATFTIQEMSHADSDSMAIVELKESLFGNISDRIDSLVYIPLSSRKNMIGNIDNIIHRDGRFYIQDKTRDALLVYDEEGNFISKIGNRGRAGNEYLRVSDIAIDAHGNIWIIDELGSKAIAYDKNGKYIKHVRHDLMFMGMKMLGDSAAVFTMGPWQNQGTAMEQFGLALQNNSDTLVTAFRYLPVQSGHCAGNTLISGENRILFKPTFSDTLYAISNEGTYSRAYYFDIPGSAWEKNKNSDKFINILNEPNRIMPWIFETEDFLLAYTDYGKQWDKNKRMTIILYNRKTGETELFHAQDMDNKSDLEKFCGYNWIGTSGQWFICTISPSTFVDNNIPEKISKGEIKLDNKPFEKALSKFDEESNPIIVLVKFKTSK